MKVISLSISLSRLPWNDKVGDNDNNNNNNNNNNKKQPPPKY